jgi:broad specificity phosphatase PhoE
MAPYIHVIRHAQGHHNLRRQWDMVEPDLTGEGINQCLRLRETTRDLQDRITHVVSSPSWRCIRTAVVSFPDVIMWPGMEIILHPHLQEVANSPCNIPHGIATIEELAGDYVNTDLLVGGPDFRDRSPFSPYRWATEAVLERARGARTWLRQLAQTAGDDAHIVVVTHGGFANWLVGGDVQPWYNTTLRSYQFADLFGDDDEAELIEDDEVDFGPGPEDQDDVDDDDDNDEGGGDGSPGPSRSILKRRHDDDDDDEGGAGAGSKFKKRKSVSWSEQLEHVRVFNLRLAAINKAKATAEKAEAKMAKLSKKGKKVEKVSTKKPKDVRDKRRHPALFVQFNKHSVTKTIALRARQIQRFASAFPEDDTFSAVEFSQARAMQPLDALDQKGGEVAWPKVWTSSNPGRMNSLNSFLAKWRKLFPGMDARDLFKCKSALSATGTSSGTFT